MLRNLLIAIVIACPLMLTLIAQDPAMPEESVLDPTKTSQVAQAEAQQEQRKEIIVRKSSRGEPTAYLEVYSVGNGDTLEVVKTLRSLALPGARILNDDVKTRQIHILASADQHQQFRQVIKQLNASESAKATNTTSKAEPAERKFDVSVAWVRKDWSEQLGEKVSVLGDLKKLYDDDELKPLGGELLQAAPALLFPANRASIFELKDGHRMIHSLIQLQLLERVPVVEKETEEQARFTLEKYSVPELDYPAVRPVAIGDHGPFAKHRGVWSIGVGTYTHEDSVIADTEYTQFVEMAWPSQSKAVERRQIASDHFGSRFSFTPGEISVLRWPSWQRGEPVPLNHSMIVPENAEDRSGSTKKKKHAWFPVVIIGYAGDPKPEFPESSTLGFTWTKPLRSMRLGSFDYAQSKLNSRRSMTSRYGYTRVEPLASQQTKIAIDDRGKAAPFHMIPLKFAEAEETSKLVRQMFANDDAVLVLSEPKINALYISAPEKSMTKVKEIVTALDSESPLKARFPGVTAGKSVEMEVTDLGTVILKGSKENVTAAEGVLRQMSSQQLHAHSKKLEKEAATVAAQYAADRSGKKDLAALKKTVTEDFEVRQRLQLAEIEFLKARLEDLERRVRQKEKLKSQIIDRRIETLLKQPQDDKSSLAPEHL